MEERSDWTEADRLDVEARLAAARRAGDASAEIEALIDLAVVCRTLGDAWTLVTVAQEAWTLAQNQGRWDQLARLALLFGQVALSGLDYQQCYDHYANACAYAVMWSGTDGGLYEAVVYQVDAALQEMLDSGMNIVAEAFCEMLVLYEAEGGLGGPTPVFADHFRRYLTDIQAARRRELALSQSPN